MNKTNKQTNKKKTQKKLLVNIFSGKTYEINDLAGKHSGSQSK